MSKSRRSKRRGQRGGFILFAVLAVIAIGMSLMAAWVKLLADHRETVRTAELNAQATWVAESAISRLAARLAAEKEFRDEAWHGMETPDGREWLAEMIVQPVEGRPTLFQARIKVIARDEQSILLTRTVELTIDRDRLRADLKAVE